MKNLILFLSLVLVVGCAHTTIPEYWATYDEAYPTSSIEDCNSLSSGSCRRATFNYSFEDVYSAAIIALTNSQINVQDENKSSGDIFAVRSELIYGRTHKYLYRVNISELEAEKCTVSVFSKTQGSGEKNDLLKSSLYTGLIAGGIMALTMVLVDADGSTIALAGLGMAAVSVAIILAFGIPINNVEEERAELKWTPNDDEYLDRIILFIRKDLLESGY